MIPLSGGVSFHQYLEAQLQSLILNDLERPIAEFLIGSIDNSGYLRRTLVDLIDDLAFTQNTVVDEYQLKTVLDKIQSLDPPGVGARSLQECLSIQLSRKETDKPLISLSKKIVSGKNKGRVIIKFS